MYECCQNLPGVVTRDLDLTGAAPGSRGSLLSLFILEAIEFDHMNEHTARASQHVVA